MRPVPILLAFAASCASPTLERFEFERPKWGTTFRIVLYAGDRAQAERAAEAGFARVDALGSALSDYDATSEVSRLPRSTGAVAVSADLWAVLVLARDVSERTGGAFDVTVGPYVRLWRRAERRGEHPSAERLAEASRSVGHALLRFDPEARTVEPRVPGMRLDLGGVAKGYALDRVLAELAEVGIDRALVDGGGDVACGLPPPGEDGWHVALAPEGESGPTVAVELARAAVATSGDAYRHVEIDGVRYSHVVDPATGIGVSTRVAASVVAADGATADAWASALCVLGPARGLELVEREEGIEARLVDAEGRVHRTSGFPARPAPEGH